MINSISGGAPPRHHGARSSRRPIWGVQFGHGVTRNSIVHLLALHVAGSRRGSVCPLLLYALLPSILTYLLPSLVPSLHLSLSPREDLLGALPLVTISLAAGFMINLAYFALIKFGSPLTTHVSGCTKVRACVRACVRE